jgi:hypothetical protein
MKGTLAVSTLGGSVAAEKAVRAAAAGLSTKSATAGDLGEDQIADGVLFVGKSHDPGRNADVTLYSDRIERVKERSIASLSKARQDTEMTPVRSVTSVQAKKEGFFTRVTVYAAGNDIQFRFRHDAALQFKDALQALLLAPPPAAEPSPSAPPDLAEQITKLGQLRDNGLITDEEFQAKKSEFLERM